MTLAVVAYTLLAFLGNSLPESADAQRSNVGDSWNVIKSLESLTKAVLDLREEVQMQAALLNSSIAEQNKRNTCFQNFEAEKAGEEGVDQPMTNRTIVALTGDDVDILCVAAGTSLSQIKWKRDNGMLRLDRVQYENYGMALRIKNVEVTDSGTYICDAADEAGTLLSHSISLEVYAQSQQCHTLIESDKGNLEMETLSAGCLLIIKLENTTGFRLELHTLMKEPILVIPEQNPANSNFQSVRIYGGKNVSHAFEGKSLAIVVPPGRERTTLNWTGVRPNDSRVTSSTEIQNDSEEMLEWEPTGEGSHKIFWVLELQVKEKLSWTLKTDDRSPTPEHPCVGTSLAVLEINLDGNVSEIERTCEGSSMGSLISERGSIVLILVHMKSVTEARPNLGVTWGPHGVPLKKNVEGIIAGTEGGGDVVIPFNSTQTRPVSSDKVYGLAFDWNSRKIFKSQHGVGIMRTNLNGNESKTLLYDPFSSLYGIAIEPISGNLYYGNRTSRNIRVCSNDATKCTSIANSSDLSSVRDFAFHSSEGLLFWSIYDMKIVRANFDGSNATVILNGIKVRGIDVDEQENRLYWGGSEEGIRSCDLMGKDIQMLRSLRGVIIDVAIHHERVYYSTESEKNINVVSKLGSNTSLLKQVTNYPYHIALFGTRVSNKPPNPCEKSRCAHLCVVVSPSSYRCMCPENRELNADRKTCQL